MCRSHCSAQTSCGGNLLKWNCYESSQQFSDCDLILKMSTNDWIGKEKQKASRALKAEKHLILFNLVFATQNYSSSNM